MSTNKFLRALIFSALLLPAYSSCSRDVVYDLGTLQPSDSGTKTELKDDLQFMSMAYRDLFGAEIPAPELQMLREAYNSIGDKELIIDKVVQALLLSPDLVLPPDTELAADPEGFLTATYKKFFLREPSAFEQAFWQAKLAQDTTLNVRDIYYVFMTSNEYKYY